MEDLSRLPLTPCIPWFWDNRVEDDAPSPQHQQWLLHEWQAVMLSWGQLPPHLSLRPVLFAGEQILPLHPSTWTDVTVPTLPLSEHTQTHALSATGSSWWHSPSSDGNQEQWQARGFEEKKDSRQVGQKGSPGWNYQGCRVQNQHWKAAWHHKSSWLQNKSWEAHRHDQSRWLQGQPRSTSG